MKKRVNIFHFLIIGSSVILVRNTNSMGPKKYRSKNRDLTKQVASRSAIANYDNPPSLGTRKLGDVGIIPVRKQVEHKKQEPRKVAPIITKKNVKDEKQKSKISTPHFTLIEKEADLVSQLNNHIINKRYQATYSLLQKSRFLQKQLILGSKLFEIASDKIKTVKEFCENLSKFPINTGFMSKNIAVICGNRKFCENYDDLLDEIDETEERKEQLSSIIIALLKNREYVTAGRIL